jgi:hypothetical protein
MTIRRRILLGITPVFAALALVGNGVRYYLERKSTLDGLQEQAGTFATALAAFPRTGEWAKLDQNRADETAYPAALERLDRWNMLRGVVIWHGRDKRVLLRWRNDSEIPPATTAKLQRLGPGAPFVASDLIQTGPDASIVTAYALMRDSAANPVGIVGVSIDASYFAVELRALRKKLVRNTLFVSLLGAALAVALASRLSFELRRLTRAAAGIESGRYVPPPVGVIAEISDVSDTFGVLDGVIDEVRAKSHRAFVENEQFRTEEELLRVFRDEFLPPATLTRAGLQVGAATTGSSPAIFREAGPDATPGRLCFGRVEGPVALETAILASSTGREIEDRLARGDDPAAALLSTAALFPLQTATVLTWTASGSEVSRWDYANGSVRLTALAAPRDRGLVCHDLPAAAAESLELYLRRFPSETPAQWLKDLSQLAGETSGTVVVLSRA